MITILKTIPNITTALSPPDDHQCADLSNVAKRGANLKKMNSEKLEVNKTKGAAQ